jgi:hypothetical protein
MSRSSPGRRIAPVAGAVVTALIAAMALAPAALASPQTRVNFFKYNPNDATHHALWFNATNTGTNPYLDFEIELTQTTKISNVVLYITGSKTPHYVCTAQNGGWPAITCNSLPPTLLKPGTTFGIQFKTSTVYPAGSQNLWFADDQASGANEGEFDGPV